MYAVIRKFSNMRNVEEAGRRAEAGLAPILRQSPGFRGYYVVNAGNNGGASISLFESQEAAEQAQKKAMAWIGENLADLAGGEPEIIAGQVLVSATAQPGAGM
jgi:hypothetical protein